MLGYLSPLLLFLKPAPSPVAIARPAPTPTPRIESRPQAPASPPAPPWRYEKPDGFDKANVSLRVVVDAKTIGEVATDTPIALSPDDGALAYCPKSDGGKTIVVIELDSLNPLARFALAEPVDYFAWDAGSRRLFYTSAGRGRTVGVLDLARSRNTSLPIPSGQGVPVSPVAWWTDKEVAFFGTTRPDQSLNLDTLRMRKLDSLSEWTALPEARRKALLSTDAQRLPASSAGTMQFTLRILSYQVPEVAPLEILWPAKAALCLKWKDAKTETGHFTDAIHIETNDRLLAPADGSKLVRIHDGNIVIFYFGIGDVSFPCWKLKMPASPDKAKFKPPVTELLQKWNSAHSSAHRSSIR